MSERVKQESPDLVSPSPDVSAPNSEPSRTMDATVERLKANLVKEDRKILALQRTAMLRTATTETSKATSDSVSNWVQNDTRIAIAGFEVTAVRVRSADRLRQSWAHFLATIAGSSTRIEILTTLSYDADLVLKLRIDCIGRGGRDIADKRCQQAVRFVRSMQETILPDLQHGPAVNRPILPQFSEVVELKRPAGAHEYSKTSIVPGITVESLLRALQRDCGSAVMIHFVRHSLPALHDDDDIVRVGGRGKPDSHADRVSQAVGPMFAARVFVGQLSASDPCLIEIAGNCLLSDAQPVAKTRCAETQIVRSLSSPEESEVYDLTGLMNLLPVAVAVGDRPGFQRLPGILAPWSGTTGTDAPYGITVDPLRSRPLSSTTNARCSHLFVCGKTGTGKSSLLLNRSLFDIQQGRGICVIDPHGSLIEDILSRMPPERAGDVILLDPGESDRPVGFNPLVISADSPLSYRRECDRTVSDLLMDVEHAFKEQWAHISGPVCETYMRSSLSMLMGIAQPSPQEVPHLGLVRPFFSNAEFRKRMQARLLGHEPMLDDFIREAESATRDLSLRDVSGYITSRFNRFLCEAGMHNMICQRRSVDLTRAIQNKQIILCHPRRGELGEHSARLLASMLVSRLRRAIIAVGRSENADPFCLYADECQLFADGRIASLLNEGRKFGMSVTLATQHLNNLQSDVVSAILGNVAGTVLFRQSPKDAEFFSQSLMAAPASHLVQLPNFEAVVVDSVSLGQQSAQFRLPQTAAIRNPNQSTRVREISRLAYGTPESQIESELDETRIALLGNA